MVESPEINETCGVGLGVTQADEHVKEKNKEHVKEKKTIESPEKDDVEGCVNYAAINKNTVTANERWSCNESVDEQRLVQESEDGSAPPEEKVARSALVDDDPRRTEVVPENQSASMLHDWCQPGGQADKLPPPENRG